MLYREQTGFAYLLVAAVSMAFGTLMTIKKPKSHVFYLKEGCVATALSWIFLSFFGALPFWISGEIPSLIDALFDSFWFYDNRFKYFSRCGSTFSLCFILEKLYSLDWRYGSTGIPSCGYSVKWRFSY